MKKQILTVGVITLLVAIGLSGCASLGKNQILSVTIRAEAKTNSLNVVEQSVDFEFRKTGGETFTLDRIFVVDIGNQGWNFTTNYAEVGYNLHKGEIITVFMYHSLAVPAEQTITYSYDDVLATALEQNNPSGDSDTLYVTLTPTFYLEDS
jgi:hypothetical protein